MVPPQRYKVVHQLICTVFADSVTEAVREGHDWEDGRTYAIPINSLPSHDDLATVIELARQNVIDDSRDMEGEGIKQQLAIDKVSMFLEQVFEVDL